MPEYCDECQLPVEECEEYCEGRIARAYRKELAAWEQSDEWVSEPPY